jgi:hypothetical protein
MYVCVYVCMCVFVCVCVYVCVCMYVCMYVYMYLTHTYAMCDVQSLLREQKTLEIVLRMINKLIPLSESSDKKISLASVDSR